MCAAVSTTYTYSGKSSVITFISDGKGLSVTIDTLRMRLRSVQRRQDDYNRYAFLFADQEVMSKFASGQTRTKEEIETRINDVWTKNWHRGDPFSGLAVFRRGTDEFLGHVVLGHSDIPGVSEIAYLFHRIYWGQGYGSEAVTALVKDYAPAIIEAGYSIDGKPLKKIVATTRVDNPASVRILEKVGMHLKSEEEKFGALRKHYFLNVNEEMTSCWWCAIL